MSPVVWSVVLPDRWRVQLLREPSLRERWLLAVSEARPPCRLLDWEDRLPGRLIVAALDLSVAELLVKLPASVTVVAIDAVLEPHGQLGRGASRLLARAKAMGGTWVAPPHPASGVPTDPAAYLAPALLAAGERS